MAERKKQANELPKKVDGQYTFYGVYADYRKELKEARKWEPKTVKD
ncbi:hypothetical protein LJC64_05185 [Ruminococcaceae bacterium OttesenSCG-928-A11]|nr:hypothetical protein [Ruminococcaceae bacterium OttesenSCG-928-A11]